MNCPLTFPWPARQQCPGKTRGTAAVFARGTAKPHREHMQAMPHEGASTHRRLSVRSLAVFGSSA